MTMTGETSCQTSSQNVSAFPLPPPPLVNRGSGKRKLKQFTRADAPQHPNSPLQTLQKT